MRKERPKKKHIILPDPKFNDTLVTKFVNNMMKQGKKHIAFKIFYKAMDIIAERMKKEKKSPIDIWKQALANATPNVEVRSRRIGGATFQVPQEVRPERKISLSIKHIIRYARLRKGKPMPEKLAEEIISAYHNEGGAVKKKEEIHRMAEANKAFSHFKF